jgi:DNA-binding NarL/FixJ family response regulator
LGFRGFSLPDWQPCSKLLSRFAGANSSIYAITLRIGGIIPMENRRTKIAMLVIEDDIPTLELYHRILQTSFPDHIVHTASTPDEALGLFRKHYHKIVISDVRMQTDGIRAACEICQIQSTTFILFVTAESHIMCKHRIDNICIKEIFSKPLDVTLLTRRIAEIITSLSRIK